MVGRTLWVPYVAERGTLKFPIGITGIAPVGLDLRAARRRGFMVITNAGKVPRAREFTPDSLDHRSSRKFENGEKYKTLTMSERGAMTILGTVGRGGQVVRYNIRCDLSESGRR
jgi:hypothetical protein